MQVQSTPEELAAAEAVVLIPTILANQATVDADLSLLSQDESRHIRRTGKALQATTPNIQNPT